MSGAVCFADRLSLAAAPVFGGMALLTALGPGDAAGMLCAAARDPWTAGGMIPMYLLMTVFHVPPWMRLISALPSRRR